jgi:hypothetical protein
MAIRRIFGALLCILLISASATTAYATFSSLNCGIAIYLPPSFVSLDPFDDFTDVGYPDGVVNRSVRDKVTFKESLLLKARIANFLPQALLIPPTLPQAFSSQQQLYRFQEVFRI